MDKKFLSMISVLFLAAIIFISLTVFKDQFSTFTRASQQEISSSLSLVIVNGKPLIDLTDKTDHKIQINVFLRSADTGVISGDRRVVVTAMDSKNDAQANKFGFITSNNSEDVSNIDSDPNSAEFITKDGKAYFTLSPQTDSKGNPMAGTVYIHAKVITTNDEAQPVELKLIQTPSVKFDL